MLLFKMIKSNNLFRSVSIYTFGHIVNAMLPFLLMPVLTRYLSPEDYGITAMLGVLVGIYTPFIGLNLYGFISVSYFRNRYDFSLVISTTFLIVAISIFIATICTFFFVDEIVALSLFPKDWLWTVICLCTTNYFIMVLQVIQQSQNHAREYTLVQLGQTILNFLLSIFMVVVLSMDWKGRVLAQVITGIMFMGGALLLFRKWDLLKFGFSVECAKQSLKYGIPLIPHALCGFITVAADRVLISNMISLEEVGIFTVGASIGKGVELLGVSFNKAFCPWLYKKLNEFDEGIDNDKKKVVKFSYLCMCGFVFSAVIYSICMPYGLNFFVGQKFQESSQYIWGFSLSSAFASIYYLVTNYIFYMQKTHILALITLFSSILHIGIAYIMIKQCGAIGASYAAIITQLVIVLATWRIASKVYPMPWKLWNY